MKKNNYLCNEMKHFGIKLFLLLLCAICGRGAAGQSPAFAPPSFNYTVKDYKAGNQNWAIAQGTNGVIYIGNDYGLLSFDAVNWELHRLPNNLSVKSILVDASPAGEERIYVGSFEEFGYFVKDAKNQLTYHSLKGLVKDYSFNNDEIWTISKLENRLFFQSFSSYFIYNEKEGAIEAIHPHPAPLYFFPVGRQLYAQFINNDFCVLEDKRFVPILTRNRINHDDIVSVLPDANGLILVTSQNGLYRFEPERKYLSRFKTAIDHELSAEKVNRVTMLSDSTFVLGTLNNGIYALKADGGMLWQLNMNNGLYNNTVLALFADREANLWAALDNGISCIPTRSPLSFFEPQNIRIGLVEDVAAGNDALYIATNQGIYKHLPENNEVRRLPGFNAQTWYVRNFNNQIITGNNQGTFFIENDTRVEIPYTSAGGTDIKEMKLYGKDFLLESTYSVLQIYFREKSGKWSYSHSVNGFLDLIDGIESDHTGNIWATHMYKGVYRLRFDETLRRIVQKEFFEKMGDNTKPAKPVRAMKLRGRIVFTDGIAFYTYDDIEEKITPFDQLNRELPGLVDTRKIVPINDTFSWFIRPAEYTLVEYAAGRYGIHDKIPFAVLNNPPNVRRGNIHVDKNNVSYFGLNGGIGKYNFSLAQHNHPPAVELHRIESYSRRNGKRELLFADRENTIDYSGNNLVFQLRYVDFGQKSTLIESFLENYDAHWTAVAPDLKIAYSNLPADFYRLKIRVLNDQGEPLSTLSIPFRIKNPWYKTVWAVSIYIVIGILLLVLIIRNYTRRIIKRKNQIFAEEEKNRIMQIERQEKLIAELKSERLENELIHKGKELASASLLIINHEELLNKLKKEIQENMKTSKISRTQGIELVKMINSNLSGQDEWAVFQENFDLIHENFFRKLTERYPVLTSSDLRFCALLRLNYSSKDIAKMLNLTLRGVEAARYRLRKKLSLGEEESLTSFMMNLE